jgi:hypothetical protein
VVPITLYARSDVAGITIPTESGGCGEFHSRPVTKGAPAKTFRLDCPPCEAYLRGERKPKILKHKIENGRVVSQERVADADPMFSSNPDALPLTPDEERLNKTRQERGAQQIQMIQALTALRASGIEVPAEAMWLLERELPSGILKGTVLCVNGHDNQAGVKFCGECGTSMAARGAIGSSGEGASEPAPVDLERLHVATLRKMARQKGLPDKGSKDVLIGRLQAA